jgi:hypothetical protein
LLGTLGVDVQWLGGLGLVTVVEALLLWDSGLTRGGCPGNPQGSSADVLGAKAAATRPLVFNSFQSARIYGIGGSSGSSGHRSPLVWTKRARRSETLPIFSSAFF